MTTRAAKTYRDRSLDGEIKLYADFPLLGRGYRYGGVSYGDPHLRVSTNRYDTAVTVDIREWLPTTSGPTNFVPARGIRFDLVYLDALIYALALIREDIKRGLVPTPERALPRYLLSSLQEQMASGDFTFAPPPPPRVSSRDDVDLTAVEHVFDEIDFSR